MGCAEPGDNRASSDKIVHATNTMAQGTTRDMDQIAAMRSFRKVLEQGSFSAAARQLGLSKAAVSKQVSELESFLGSTLIHRTTRRLHPTDAGQAYFESV